MPIALWSYTATERVWSRHRTDSIAIATPTGSIGYVGWFWRGEEVSVSRSNNRMRPRLTPTQFMTNLAKRVPLAMSGGVESCSHKYSCAAVACILKVTSPTLTHNIKHLEDASYYVRNGGCVHVLFIKRTHRGGDRWSGDTAFPGGYLEVEESDLDGVKREINEELNIDLNDSQLYAWLGRLGHINFGDKTKMLYPHVFLYLGHADPVITPTPSEVTGVEWINLETLLMHNADSLDFRSASLDATFLRVAGWHSALRQITVSFAGLLGCSTVYFPCINMPISSKAIWADISMENPRVFLNGDESVTQWVLWGMTLRFVCDLMQVGNDHGAPYLQPKMPFWVDNAIFNTYLKFWHGRIVYSGSHTVSGTLLLSLSLAGTLGTYVLAGAGIWCTADYMYTTLVP